jgi:3-methylcrotonyl-CoA carboxylase alpha subunit
VRLLGDSDVRSGDVDTGLIAREGDALLCDPAPTARDLSDAGAWLARQSTNFSPMTTALFGFRLNRGPERKVALDVNGERTEFEFEPSTTGYYDCGFRELASKTEQLMLKRGAHYLISISRATGGASGTAGDGAIVSPMPGKLIAVEVRQGDAVTKGQKLVTLEAMKMEHPITAPHDGTVAEIHVAVGENVAEGARLVRIEGA